MPKNMFSQVQSIGYRGGGTGQRVGSGRLIVQTNVNSPDTFHRESKAKRPGVDAILAVSSPGQRTQGLKDLGFRALFKHENPNSHNVCTVWAKWGIGKSVEGRQRTQTYVVGNTEEGRVYSQGFPWYCGGGLRTILQGPIRREDSDFLRMVQTNLSPGVAKAMKRADFVLVKTFPDWKLWRSRGNVRAIR